MNDVRWQENTGDMLGTVVHEEGEGLTGPCDGDVQQISFLSIIGEPTATDEIVLVQEDMVVFRSFRTVYGSEGHQTISAVLTQHIPYK